MNDTFFRFPHTPHLVWEGAGVPRDDKVLAPTIATALLAAPVVVEEKVDGANVGFSSLAPDGTLRAQSRGSYLAAPWRGQYSRLSGWLAQHQRDLERMLRGNLLAFGEWCAARHAIRYERLPDWWLLFDVYDRDAGRFFSTARRDAWAKSAGVTVVATLHNGRVDTNLLRHLAAGPSRYRAGTPEGVVVRRENAQWLDTRAKLVNPQFSRSLAEHWRNRPIEWNRLASTTPPQREKMAR